MHRPLSRSGRPLSLGLSLMACLLAVCANSSAIAAVGWVDSLADGVKQAEETGKPLFVVFRCVR